MFTVDEFVMLLSTLFAADWYEEKLLIAEFLSDIIVSL